MESTIVELSQNLQEARKVERQNENKDKKISDQISSQGPALSLPKIHSPTDIINWMKFYKQVSKFVHSDITKLALIKSSLTGKDRKSVEHLNTVGGVISFIHDKYLKGDLVLNIPIKQGYDLPKNIEAFLLIISNFCEWKLQAHINSKFRDDMVPLLFTKE